MSKELTEQWRNGNIQETYYYVKCPWSEGEVDIRYVHNGVDDWKEIVDPVPSYPDLCELKQDLEICKDDKADLYAKLCNALMQLEECKQKVHIMNESAMNMENAIGSQADYFQQQISVLEDRLKEAETIIKLYFKNTQNATYKSLGMKDGYYKKDFIHAVAKEYLERYGVK